MVRFNDSKGMVAALRAAKAAQRGMGRHSLGKGIVRLSGYAWGDGCVEYWAEDGLHVRQHCDGVTTNGTGTSGCVNIDDILPFASKGHAVTLADGRLTIGAASRSAMPSDRIPDFLEVAELPSEAAIIVRPEALAWVAQACASDSARAALCHVWVDSSGRLTAADGFRLHVAGAAVDGPLTGGQFGIPAPVAEVLARTAKASKNGRSLYTLMIARSADGSRSGLLCADLGLTFAWTGDIERGADFNRVIDPAAAAPIVGWGRTKDLRDALAIVAPMAKEDINLVAVEAAEGSPLLLTGYGIDGNTAVTEAECSQGNLSHKFNVDCVYMAEALAGLSGTTVDIHQADPNTPIYITDGPAAAVIMPMYIRR